MALVLYASSDVLGILGSLDVCRAHLVSFGNVVVS